MSDIEILRQLLQRSTKKRAQMPETFDSLKIVTWDTARS